VGTGLLVAGVHRSGTSIAARLAASLGLRLPPSDDLVRANAGNPDGYWESRSLAELNDRVLLRWGHSWRYPPGAVAPAMLVEAADVVPTAAAQFEACFGTADGWVWKDPRLAVLLPFWDGVIGSGHPVLFPHREPQGVARSIARRDGVTYAQGLAVWERCTRLALSGMAGHRVFVTDYARLLADPVGWRGELAGFCRATGVPLPGSAEPVADLVHAPASSPEGWLSPEQASLHALVRELTGVHEPLGPVALGAESPWVEDALQSLAGTPAAEAEVQRLDRELREEQERSLGHVRRLEADLEREQARTVSEVRRLEAELGAAHAAASAALAERGTEIEALHSALLAAHAERDRLAAQLEAITSSRGWHAVERYRAVHHAVGRRMGRGRPDAS
jgi:hypothetical protein